MTEVQEQMVVGFTGTIQGMTANQWLTFRRLLRELKATGLHHGDCLGADAQSHITAREMALAIVVHPPTDPKSRAYMDKEDGASLEVRTPKPYLKRNKDVVDESKCLIAAPRGFKPMMRSGTWATVRYANKAGKPVYIVWPDGSMTRPDGTVKR